jgi:hypothetical protein
MSLNTEVNSNDEDVFFKFDAANNEGDDDTGEIDDGRVPIATIVNVRKESKDDGEATQVITGLSLIGHDK